MKKLWDLKKVFSNLELEGQGHGIIMGGTRLLLLGPFYTILTKRDQTFWRGVYLCHFYSKIILILYTQNWYCITKVMLLCMLPYHILPTFWWFFRKACLVAYSLDKRVKVGLSKSVKALRVTRGPKNSHSITQAEIGLGSWSHFNTKVAYE